jgi:hypothetical protein
MTAPALSAPLRDRRFFMAMAVVIAAIVFVGFAPTFYLRAFYHPEPLQSVFHIHGLVFTSWVVLFVVQTSLVSARRTDLHRRLGVLGGVLALLMWVVGYQAAVTAARRGFSMPGLPPPLVFLAVPIFDLLVFATLVGTGLYLRRKPAAHKRLMLLSTLAVLTAAIARLPYVLPLGPPAFFGLTDLLVIAAMIYDWRTRGRVHSALLWGGLFLIASQPLRLAISGTDTWLALATWLTR